MISHRMYLSGNEHCDSRFRSHDNARTAQELVYFLLDVNYSYDEGSRNNNVFSESHPAAETGGNVQDLEGSAAFRGDLHLSPRQHEIAAYLAAGLTEAEIGKALSISPRTVRMHCDALRFRLRVTKRRHIPAAYREKLRQEPLDFYFERRDEVEARKPL
jgi:DNA-binding CsgD family transcriptional regulator